MKILVIEDEQPMLDAIAAILVDNHYEVDCVSDGLQGRDYIKTLEYDLILMDIMLPGMDGFSLLSFMREKKIPTPVICLTARSEHEYVVKGLDLGADDYLAKPFDARELLARIRARTRSDKNGCPNELRVGNIRLDQMKCILYGPEKSVKLGKTEFKVLEYLMQHPGKLLGRERIILKVWGCENESEYNNLTNYVSFVRKKLRFVEADRTIITYRNIGYSMEKNDEEETGQ